MKNYIDIIQQYYIPGTFLYDLLIKHSTQVAEKSVEIAKQINADVDMNFLYEAAMLHDIGILHTNAPSIFCVGKLPYITHGVEGAEMLRKEGLEKHALVCERHTGSGIAKEEIIKQNLPLPHHDMLPQSLEEKIICYADKFYSKSHPNREKTVEKIRQEMEHFGPDTLARFNELHALFA